MKQIQIALPDPVASQLEALVRGGWFQSEEEAVRVAILEFLRDNTLALSEQFQREDIQWALQQREPAR